jgi:PKD repeat protein
VDFRNPDSSYGNDTELHVRADNQARRTYLKFDLSVVPAGTTVTSAKLYLYCTAANPADPLQVDVHETNDSWSEDTITWNNAPAIGALVTSNMQVNGTGQYYYWDITSYAQSQHGGDKILSVVVKFPLDDPNQDNPNYHRDFASKEYNGTSYDPYLEITYTEQAPVASFTYSPLYPVCNETITFNASDSYDPDGNIVSYQWDFGDGNITTVNDPIITHIYTTANSTVNYTVTLTVTDNDGLTNSTTATVMVTNPAILRVSIPDGEDRTGISDPDPWLNECWLLNITGASGTFTVKIEDVSAAIWSYDTRLVIALNDAAYNNLVNLTVNNVTIVKNDFKYGTLRPYNLWDWPSGDVYPTWFNDTLVNVGTIPPKGHVNVTVSVTFSNATGARMHFDAYGSKESSPIPPTTRCYITHNPLSEDSTVLFAPPPVVQYYLTVETDPADIVTIPGEGWYDNCTYVNLTAPQYVNVSVDTRYRFDYWDVDGVSQGIGVNPITVHMDSPHTATAHYQVAPPPPAVGGHALPINLDPGTSNSLTPQIGLASVLTAVIAVTIILARRRKKTLKRER